MISTASASADTRIHHRRPSNSLADTADGTRQAAAKPHATPAAAAAAATPPSTAGKPTTVALARPEVPLWASAAVLTASALSAVGIAYAGPYLGNPSRPQDALPYVVAAIPFFFLQMAVEFVVIRVSGIDKHSPAARYDFADSWSSVSAGGMQQLFVKLVVSPVAKGGAYIWVHENTRHWPIPRPSMEHTFDFVLLLLAIDFTYYWFHRCSHTNALLWLGHSVHHDAEHYNFSTAMRQGMLQVAGSWMFELWEALFFPPRAYMTYVQINTLYQFWVHTCCVRRLGPLEQIIMTPSHHRVHHDRRVHKNFGGILVVWDKLFGSFLDESQGFSAATGNHAADTVRVVRAEQVYFGQKRRPQSWGFALLQLDEPIALAKRVAKAFGRGGITAAAQALMKGPGYYTAGMRRRNTLPERAAMPRFRLESVPIAPGTDGAAVGTPVSNWHHWSLWHLYVHTAAAYGMVIFVIVSDALTVPQALVWSAVPVTGMVCAGYLLDSGRYGVQVERFRCIVMAAVTAAFLVKENKVPLVHSTDVSAVGLLFAIHFVSAVLMCVRPDRFERQCLRPA